MLPNDLLKVLVTHHPFDLPESYGHRDLVKTSGACDVSVRSMRC